MAEHAAFFKPSRGTGQVAGIPLCEAQVEEDIHLVTCRANGTCHFKCGDMVPQSLVRAPCRTVSTADAREGDGLGPPVTDFDQHGQHETV